MKPRLLIDDISTEEFCEIKSTYLNSEQLDKKSLEKITELFNLGKNSIARVHC